VSRLPAAGIPDSYAPLGAAPEAAAFSSARYWKQRYRLGGNFGAGSSRRLGRIKAEFVNAFVEQNDIRKRRFPISWCLLGGSDPAAC
jgi:hypothetical protein